MKTGRERVAYVALYAVLLGAAAGGLWLLVSSGTLRLPVWAVTIAAIVLAGLCDLAADLLAQQVDRRTRGQAVPQHRKEPVA
ncbi:hypothetical protein [Streptomyces sp. NPDC056982]|uniref:hypothetical protein n=1 Tax=Streptomyces sp. NPDC056982 TaxID=3345986 RepID=UPI00363CF161